MQLSAILFAAFLGLGANAAAVPEAEAMEANFIGMGDKHYGVSNNLASLKTNTK